VGRSEYASIIYAQLMHNGYITQLLAQNNPENLKNAVHYFQLAEKAGYEPAKVALGYLNKNYPNGVPDHIDQPLSESYAKEILINTGFSAGIALIFKSSTPTK
jgi:hypothetical protein